MLRVKPQNWAIRPQVSMASPWAHFSRSRARRETAEAATSAVHRAPILGRAQGHQGFLVVVEGARGQLPAGGIDVIAARGADVNREAMGAQGVLEGAHALG